MKSINWLLVTAITAILTGCATSKTDSMGRQKIYDETADGSQQIAKALTQAKNESKRVLIQLGANWSEGCHRLYDVFKSNMAVSQELQSDYIWVLVDLDQGHNAEVDQQYGNATRFGYPALVILDADGKQLVGTGGDDFEQAGHHDLVKLVAFL